MTKIGYFSGSDEAILASKKHLQERLNIQPKRRDSNVSMISTITQLGNDSVRVTKNSISSAFSSVFRGRNSSPNSPVVHSSSPKASTEDSGLTRFEPEVRNYAMAAVVLEEWLQELAAIAQEQSVLMKEIAFQLGMALEKQQENVFKKNSSAILENQSVVINRNETLSMS